MAKKKNALGKGIESLIRNNTVNAFAEHQEINDKLSEKLIEPIIEPGPVVIPIDKILANTYQPRKIFKDKDLKELSQSIKENGLIQPIIVVKEENKFRLIAGERRLKASKMAGLESIAAIVKSHATDKERLSLAIIENIQRSDLNCIEEALAYFQLVNEFKLTQEEVAKKLGKDRSTVANFLRLLNLPRSIVDFLQREELSFGHGKVLATLKDQTKSEKLAKRAVEEGLSVRELESLLKDSPVKLPVKRDDEDMSSLKDELEKKTGMQFKLKSNKKGRGQLTVRFTDKEQFNRLYEHLMGL